MSQKIVFPKYVILKNVWNLYLFIRTIFWQIIFKCLSCKTADSRVSIRTSIESEMQPFYSLLLLKIICQNIVQLNRYKSHSLEKQVFEAFIVKN